MIRRLLVANRGEIACRVLRTARGMGISGVAVHSDADAGSAHVRLADDARRIGPASPARSYLDIDAVVGAARDSGADAIHPGCGFLAESAAFARRCEEEGIAFVGPPPGVMEVAASKTAAKALARSAGVPVADGAEVDPDAPARELSRRARKVGYPLMVKAAAGGGGRGIRLVDAPGRLREAVAEASREARIGFGDPSVFIERAAPRARHVEVQVLADSAGTVATLGDRDCSLQRRRQKVIEEAPAPGLDPGLREALAGAARRLTEAMGYVNAGTVEFLVGPDGSWHFLEVNARLQVEHPVTELVHGVDLVAWQIRVASGERLPEGFPPPAAGHAMEARVCAELPERGFAPSVGRIGRLAWPAAPAGGATLRVDSGVEAGDRVTEHYDTLVAKLVVHHPGGRDDCRRLLADAVARSEIGGIGTNLGHLAAVAGLGEFSRCEHHTRLLEERAEDILSAMADDRRMAAALACAHWFLGAGDGASAGFRVNRAPQARVSVACDGWEAEAAVSALPEGGLEVALGDGSDPVVLGDVRARPGAIDAAVAGTGRVRAAVGAGEESGPRRWTMRVRARLASCSVEIGGVLDRAGAAADPSAEERGDVVSPMHGTLSSVLVEAGSSVAKGETVATLEAMKMETPVCAPRAGTVAEVCRRAGDRVSLGEVLARLDGPADS